MRVNLVIQLTAILMLMEAIERCFCGAALCLKLKFVFDFIERFIFPFMMLRFTNFQPAYFSRKGGSPHPLLTLTAPQVRAIPHPRPSVLSLSLMSSSPLSLRALEYW